MDLLSEVRNSNPPCLLFYEHCYTSVYKSNGVVQQDIFCQSVCTKDKVKKNNGISGGKMQKLHVG